MTLQIINVTASNMTGDTNGGSEMRISVSRRFSMAYIESRGRHRQLEVNVASVHFVGSMSIYST